MVAPESSRRMCIGVTTSCSTSTSMATTERDWERPIRPVGPESLPDSWMCLRAYRQRRLSISAKGKSPQRRPSYRGRNVRAHNWELSTNMAVTDVVHLFAAKPLSHCLIWVYCFLWEQAECVVDSLAALRRSVHCHCSCYGARRRIFPGAVVSRASAVTAQEQNVH